MATLLCLPCCDIQRKRVSVWPYGVAHPQGLQSRDVSHLRNVVTSPKLVLPYPCPQANAMLVLQIWVYPTNLLLAKVPGNGGGQGGGKICNGETGACIHGSVQLPLAKRTATVTQPPLELYDTQCLPKCHCCHLSSCQIMFAHAFGPLLWSILAFRNSIVYHSMDKMTR